MREHGTLFRATTSRAARALPLLALAAAPAYAAPLLTDWHTYLDWQAYTDWHLLLLVGAIALLVAALVAKAMKSGKSAEDSDTRIPAGDRFTRRIGTMPIEPPTPIDVGS